MHFSFSLVVAGALVGFLVGLTGMGGGALMTPLLIMLFGVAPLAAVSSDLVASLFMKPVGAFVHLRKGTVDTRLAWWLTVSAAPSAFFGVLVLKSIGDSAQVQGDVKLLLGVALLLTVASMVVKPWIARRRDPVSGSAAVGSPRVRIRPLRTVLIGVFGGLAVGLTSVGSGSLIIGLLLLAYPGLRAGQLVGTDLVQAIPLVGAAALGHALFGDVRLPVTLSLLVGAIPAVYVGARLSATGGSRFVRPMLATVLVASALKLVNLATGWTIVLTAAWVVAQLAWWARNRHHAGCRHAPVEVELADLERVGAS